MFTPDQRARVRSDLLEYAARDPRISGAAITGSASSGGEDKWSDIDLAFGIADPEDQQSVLSDWTGYMYQKHAALHHLDIVAGLWIYRVFFLPDTLQVDLAFVPSNEFRPLAPTFRLVFGSANEPRTFPPPEPQSLIGMGCLYALHARSCIARQRLWQAEYMVSGIRDHALALACIRHGLPAVYGGGIERLPKETMARFEASLVQQMTSGELGRAFQLSVDGFRTEVEAADAALGERLHATLVSLGEFDPAS